MTGEPQLLISIFYFLICKQICLLEKNKSYNPAET